MPPTVSIKLKRRGSKLPTPRLPNFRLERGIHSVIETYRTFDGIHHMYQPVASKVQKETMFYETGSNSDTVDY